MLGSSQLHVLCLQPSQARLRNSEMVSSSKLQWALLSSRYDGIVVVVEDDRSAALVGYLAIVVGIKVVVEDWEIAT